MRLPQYAIWLALAVALVGCSSSPPPATADPTQARMRMVATLYHLWTEGHHGSPPANQEQFVSFMQQESSKWTSVAASPQELLTSARDNQPLVVFYGGVLKDSAETGFPWIAREKIGVDGKVYVVDLRGRVILLGSQAIEKFFPSSK
jgi:hypothetical protein